MDSEYVIIKNTSKTNCKAVALDLTWIDPCMLFLPDEAKAIPRPLAEAEHEALEYYVKRGNIILYDLGIDMGEDAK